MTPKELADEHFYRGNDLQNAKRYNEAEIEYRAGLKLFPDDPYLHYNLACALHGQVRIDATISHYREAARLKADFFEPRYELALIISWRAYKQQTYDGWCEARALVVDALAVNPGCLELLQCLSRTEWELGNKKAAILLMQKVVELDGHNLDYREYLSRLQIKAGLVREAFDTTRALFMHPDFKGSEIDKRSDRMARRAATGFKVGLVLGLYLALRRRR